MVKDKEVKSLRLQMAVDLIQTSNFGTYWLLKLSSSVRTGVI